MRTAGVPKVEKDRQVAQRWCQIANDDVGQSPTEAARHLPKEVGQRQQRDGERQILDVIDCSRLGEHDGTEKWCDQPYTAREQAAGDERQEGAADDRAESQFLLVPAEMDRKEVQHRDGKPEYGDDLADLRQHEGKRVEPVSLDPEKPRRDNLVNQDEHASQRRSGQGDAGMTDERLAGAHHPACPSAADARHVQI